MDRAYVYTVLCSTMASIGFLPTGRLAGNLLSSMSLQLGWGQEEEHTGVDGPVIFLCSCWFVGGDQVGVAQGVQPSLSWCQFKMLSDLSSCVSPVGPESRRTEVIFCHIPYPGFSTSQDLFCPQTHRQGGPPSPWPFPVCTHPPISSFLCLCNKPSFETSPLFVLGPLAL